MWVPEGWGAPSTLADTTLLSTARGSLAANSVQKASALRLLLLSQWLGDPASEPPPFTPSWLQLGPGLHPQACPGHKCRPSTALPDFFFIAHSGGWWCGRSLGDAWKRWVPGGRESGPQGSAQRRGRRPLAAGRDRAAVPCQPCSPPLVTRPSPGDAGRSLLGGGLVGVGAGDRPSCLLWVQYGVRGGEGVGRLSKTEACD